MFRRPELLIVNGKLAGKRFQVKEGGLRLGRSSSNDIHVPDGQLSRNHCFFEKVGSRLRITDLASANGTLLNGKPIGEEPVGLKIGDVIEVGETRVRVVAGAPESASAVDLGFEAPADAASGTAARKRSPLANVLWLVVVLLVAMAVFVLIRSGDAPEPAPKAAVAEDAGVVEVAYEKVDANAEGIFRYEMTLSPDGVLKVSVDDVPKENRHLDKSQRLSPAARRVLDEILDYKYVRELDGEYFGIESEPPALSSMTLKVVYATRTRTVRIVNTQEPEAFRAIREKLEAFSKNELGVWAMQYSRDKLVAFARDALALARAKYDDRNVNYGNLAAAVVAFRESIFYLETVNPKPDCHKEAQVGLETAVKELDRRYADQRFLADRACNLGQWENARRELGILLEMLPDRSDDRNREATAKLLDVEKRLKKGGK